MGVNGRRAADVLRGYRNIMHGMCLYYVWRAYAAVGASTGRQAGTAYEAWGKSEGRHPGDRNPPAGVPVFWGPKSSSSAGDVVISLGNGRVIATDYPVYGQVGECTIDERERQIGRPYLGWAESIFDQKIDFDGSSGGTSGGSSRGGYQDGSAELISFQRKLLEMGHDLGSTGADGILGPRTIAVTKFEQKKAGENGYPKAPLTQDGIPGPATNGYLDWWLAKVRKNGRPSNKTAGEINYADIQAALVRHGYKIAVDNKWGPASREALRDFQRRNGLTVDLMVGPKTWDLLNR